MSFIRFVFCFKQKTAYEMRISDWSSDVCSSDLLDLPERQVILDEQGGIAEIRVRDRLDSMRLIEDYMIAANVAAAKALEAKKSPVMRSEERRVGKECVSTCRSRWAPSH